MVAQGQDDLGCAGECNYVLRQVERLDVQGRPALWEVETCTGCGREIAARPVETPPVASLPANQ
jgi:hypothetical protein